MSIEILCDSKKIQLNIKPHESNEYFIKRVAFFLVALDLGYSIERSESLSYAWSNKIIYQVNYPEALNNILNVIESKLSS